MHAFEIAQAELFSGAAERGQHWRRNVNSHDAAAHLRGSQRQRSRTRTQVDKAGILAEPQPA